MPTTWSACSAWTRHCSARPETPAGYPAPIVDHREERGESLRRYEGTQ
jgi:deoxyribodipyrimidine photolyase